MKRLSLVGRMLNDPENLEKIEEKRITYPDDQIAFIDDLAPLFSDYLNKIPPPSRKIIFLFSRHGTKLSSMDIIRYSKLREKVVTKCLSQLDKAGILERAEGGNWRLKNNDLLRYIIVSHSGFSNWMKKKKRGTSGDIIDQYIAISNRNYVTGLRPNE